MTARDVFDRRASGIVDELRGAGQYKELRAISGPMGPVATIGGREVIVLCSNDYLGLANHPDVVAAGIEGLASHGAGTASVRFICGTLDVHDRLERAVAGLVGTPAALSFVSCWNANEALFPTVTAPGDTIVSDALNHASIIDAVRQTRGVDRKIYAHNDMAELEAALASADPGGLRWVVTDGVFSMEGDLAPLPEIVRLCRAHDAVVVVDDSHGIGVLGAAGRGTPEHFGILGEVDVVTGTLGKALGGAAGGFVAASERLIELLVQRARPSLFSNALPATVACSATRAIEILLAEPERVGRLRRNATRLRTGLRGLGFECHDAESAIIPIVLGDAHKVETASARLFELGVLVVGFSYPVVPEGRARLRVQASAALEERHLDAVLEAFAKL
ncbi:MAG: aminotransferase class I/II-fold pyridoxal phosphate-dependent enzyme [Acidimicrobiales bacterium]|jgi:glycine C-acetyltransferase